MRQWLVGGGLILGDDGLLLVRNRRRNGDLDWSPPGGVIDDGETVLAGLTREVEEETGIVVSEWQGPVYEVEVEAPGLGWHLRVEAHVALDFSGPVRVDDPDGIVVDARFMTSDDCGRSLASAHPWLAEPLGEWLGARTAGARRYRYHVDGTDRRDLTIVRQ
jgi:8-oxo-dGTP diphosphatase